MYRLFRLGLSSLALLGVSLLATGVAQAQITLNQANMQSYAFAETDAGPEFSDEIDEQATLTSNGPYTFTEFGGAPGYNSGASIGVSHDSEFATNQITLSGEAYSYVADDYGYAYCSADSQVGATVTFTLPTESRLQISGSLDFEGYPATEADAYFALRRGTEPFLAQQTSSGQVSFDQVLPGGTYQLTVLSRVWLEIDGAGGDVYEFSRGTYDLTVSATATEVAPSFQSIRQSVSVESSSDDERASDSAISRDFLPFNAAIDANLSSVTAESSLFSDLNALTGDFYAYGYAASGLYVQGTAASDADARFISNFTLSNQGEIQLSGVVGVSDSLGANQSRDDHAFARVIVRVRDLDNRVNVVNKVITLNGQVPVTSEVDLEDEFSNVALSAGRYRLIIRAFSDDTAVEEEVAGSLAVGYLEVEGRITEQAL